MAENDEITNAGIRQAQRKARATQLKNTQVIKQASVVIANFTEAVDRIEQEAT